MKNIIKDVKYHYCSKPDRIAIQRIRCGLRVKNFKSYAWIRIFRKMRIVDLR